MGDLKARGDVGCRFAGTMKLLHKSLSGGFGGLHLRENGFFHLVSNLSPGRVEINPPNSGNQPRLISPAPLNRQQPNTYLVILNPSQSLVRRSRRRLINHLFHPR
jgi:hypothetical protein